MIPLAARAHTALFATQLAPNLARPFTGTLTLNAQGGTFAAVNLTTAVNAHGELLYNALPVVDLNAAVSASRLIFPQVADGGSYSTVIYLMNPSASTPSAGTIAFFDAQGNPLAVDFGSGALNHFDFSMPPDGMMKLTSRGAGSLQCGYAMVTASSGSLPIGSSLFQLRNGSSLVSLSGVPNAPETTSARLFVETASNPPVRNSGIALVNPGITPAAIALKLTGANGQIFTASLVLGPKAHVATFLTEIFAGQIPVDFTGLLDISSTMPIASLAMRMTVNQRGEIVYAPLPMIDLQNPPAPGRIIPQVADGGGYTTRFVVLDTTASGVVYINVFDNSGVKVDGRFR